MTGEAFTENAADPKKVEEAKKREKAADRERARKILAVLNTPEGRWLYYRLLNLCGVYSNSFVANSDETAFNEGKRIVGTTLLKDVMEVAPAALELMQKENPNA